MRKALDAVAFSLCHGLRSLSIPSKLVGVARHQPAVEALVRTHDLPLALRPRLVVSITRDTPSGPERILAFAPQPDRSLARLGHIQPKHAAWLAPLLGTGRERQPSASLHLVEVTGLGRRAEGRPVTLGVNVYMTGIANIDAKTQNRSGGGERPAVLAVRLWRDADGTARMTCPHVARHSPTGPEWGYRGSGPADCARSVLLAVIDEATAEAHYQAFKDDVIATLPEHGAVIQRTARGAGLAVGPDDPRAPVRRLS